MSHPSRSPREVPLAGPQDAAHSPPQERKAEIGALVKRFYTLGRADPSLGPVFESRVSDWPKHLEAMRGFWSSAIDRTGSYHGRPLEVHRRIMEIRPEHFARWLALWEQAVADTVRPDRREAFLAMARRMARTMSPKS